MAGPIRILVAEDEPIVAIFLEDLLLEMGFQVVVTMNLAEAARAASHEALDAAILDINLNGQQSYPVAVLLAGRGIPFAFASGYGPEGREPGFAQVPVLQKPYREAQVGEMVHGLLNRPDITRIPTTP